MSVEFSNIYQEVLLENLDVIIKQNFIMQARLKLLEKETDVRAEMQAKIDELTLKHQEALQQINHTQHYKVQAESNDAIVQEKTRIQSALNDTMRELGTTKSALEARESALNATVGELNVAKNALELKEKEIGEMNLRISDLEKLISPAPKAVKKVTVKSTEEEKPVQISATETNKIRVEAGGTF
jgi:multidrug efflux pump subunit AcrA (membrane-fusion protein)